MPRRRAIEFLSCLDRTKRAVKKARDIHLVLDNCATHWPPEVQAWLDKHPRFKLSALGRPKIKADVGASHPLFMPRQSIFGDPTSGVERKHAN